MKQQRWQAAWNDYNAAVQIDAAKALSIYGRGVAALRLGRTKEGQADLAAAARLNATVATAYAADGITP